MCCKNLGRFCKRLFSFTGCQMFIEKALDPLIHYQHSPKNLFTAIKQFKSMITPYLYEYWKFLSMATEIKVKLYDIIVRYQYFKIYRRHFVTNWFAKLFIKKFSFKSFVSYFGFNYCLRKIFLNFKFCL